MSMVGVHFVHMESLDIGRVESVITRATGNYAVVRWLNLGDLQEYALSQVVEWRQEYQRKQEETST